MSGVLERMAKRAFGRLPAVQPLIRSVYAAPPVHTGEPAAAGLSIRNVEAESDAPKPVRNPARGNERQPAAPQRPRAVAAPTAEEAGKHSERRAEPGKPQGVSQPPQKPRMEAPPQTPLAPQPETAEAHGSREGLEQIAFPAPAASMRDDEIAPIAGELAPAHIGQAATPPLPRRRMRAARTEPAEPAEPKPEIHISIGSIELRAAPAEARPSPPAPFRPRVSLQEFLSRKPEARR